MLLAVHISEGVLAGPWWIGGFALAALLLAWSLYRLRDDEIPRVALLTAAVFVSSLIHVPLGPTSVHLLLSGLLGVLLGRRATLAVAVGLVLQVLLIQHGGYTSLGVNVCVITLPALLCGALFRGLHRLPLTCHPVGRGLLVAGSAMLWTLGAAFCLLLAARRVQLGWQAGWASPLPVDVYGEVFRATLQPAVLLGAALLAAGAAWLERRLENEPEFPLGLLVGGLAVLLTVGLNCAVLTFGAVEDCEVPALVLLLAHWPVAILEGVVLGFAVGFLARVKPELLGPRHPPAGPAAEPASLPGADPATPVV